MTNLAANLAETTRAHGGRVAVRVGDAAMTYRGLDEASGGAERADAEAVIVDPAGFPDLVSSAVPDFTVMDRDEARAGNDPASGAAAHPADHVVVGDAVPVGELPDLRHGHRIRQLALRRLGGFGVALVTQQRNKPPPVLHYGTAFV